MTALYINEDEQGFLILSNDDEHDIDVSNLPTEDDIQLFKMTNHFNRLIRIWSDSEAYKEGLEGHDEIAAKIAQATEKARAYTDLLISRYP